MKHAKITLLILLIAACTPDKFSGVSDKELADKQRHCDSIKKNRPALRWAVEISGRK